MIVIANVFPKLQNVKDLVKPVSWKHRFRNSFDSQQVNGCQTLVKSAWKQFYQILWSLWGEIIRKISPFVNFKILGVFVNTFTVDDKYPVWDCENLQFHIEMQLSQKQKRFSQFYVPLMESSSNSKHFQKKMIVIAYLFSKLKTVKTWVDQSVKSVVSEHRLAVNILKGSKHLWNLRESVFIIFFDHSERKWLGKYLPYWTLKSWRCLLTHWLPMRSIPLGILGICRSLFKCKYLKNEKLFLNLLFHWWNLHQILNIFGKKIIVRVNVFPN